MRYFLLIFFIGVLSTFWGSCSGKKEKPPVDSIVVYSEFHDFESITDPRTDSINVFAGKKSGLLNEKIEYGWGLEKPVKDISSYKSINEVKVSFKCMMPHLDSVSTLVFSVDDPASGKNISWEGKEIKPSLAGQWDSVTTHFHVNKNMMDPAYLVKLYIWNKGKNTFYFDNISYSFISKKR
jgi:hypothetical protein